MSGVCWGCVVDIARERIQSSCFGSLNNCPEEARGSSIFVAHIELHIWTGGGCVFATSVSDVAWSLFLFLSLSLCDCNLLGTPAIQLLTLPLRVNDLCLSGFLASGWRGRKDGASYLYVHQVSPGTWQHNSYLAVYAISIQSNIATTAVVRWRVCPEPVNQWLRLEPP